MENRMLSETEITTFDKHFNSVRGILEALALREKLPMYGEGPKGMFRHYATSSPALIELINYLRIRIDQLDQEERLSRKRSFLDLGCGLGVVTHMVKTWAGTPAYGVDICKEYIDIASLGGKSTNFKHSNIFDLRAPYLKNFTFLYMYEPMWRKKPAEKLIDFVVKKLQPHQEIIFRSGGGYGVPHLDKYVQKGKLCSIPRKLISQYQPPQFYIYKLKQ